MRSLQYHLNNLGVGDRALQQTKLKEGVEGIARYVEDVEEDWLENWNDNEE